MYKVFVYGTLMKDYWNHYLLEQSEFIAKGETVDKFTLTTSSIPFVSDKVETSTIKGELYVVDQETLDNLDSLEGHPSFYERKEVDLNIEGVGHHGWMYICNDASGTLVEDGDWRRYNNELNFN